MTLAVRKMLNLLATQRAGGERNWAPRHQQMAQLSMCRIGTRLHRGGCVTWQIT